MTNYAYRTTRSLVLAATAFAIGGATSSVLAESSARAPETAPVAVEADAMLTRASDLMVEGKLVRAKAMLVELSRGSAAVIPNSAGPRREDQTPRLPYIKRLDQSPHHPGSLPSTVGLRCLNTVGSSIWRI